MCWFLFNFCTLTYFTFNHGYYQIQYYQNWKKGANVRNRLRVQASHAWVPNILLANVPSLENKLDSLRARVKFQRDIWDCKLHCFTEKWLNPVVLDHPIQSAKYFSVYCMDRSVELGKSTGGGGSLMVNSSWCDSMSIVSLTCSFTPNLELLSSNVTLSTFLRNLLRS